MAAQHKEKIAAIDAHGKVPEVASNGPTSSIGRGNKTARQRVLSRGTRVALELP
jgi:hypothetical protein